MKSGPSSKQPKPSPLLYRLRCRLGAVGATRPDAAFTRVDLVVVLAVTMLLAVLAVPAWGQGARKSLTLVCRDNLKRLSLAWVLYSNDNNERLVMNFHGGDAQGGAAASNSRNAPWALGWLDWTTSSDNTNILYLVDDRYSRLARYFDHDARLLKCPADTYLSSAQRTRGFQERVRSCAMSACIGDGNALTGPWEAGFQQVKRTSDFLIPGPADSLVFSEEHPDSINDPMLFPPRVSSWIDQPAGFHNLGCNVTYADGHVELHHWVNAYFMMKVAYTPVGSGGSADDPDIIWVRNHCPRVRAN